MTTPIEQAEPQARAETLSELFRRQASATPEAEALVAGAERFSYARLEERVRGLAGVLRARGIRPGSVVAVMIPRSAELVITLLATLEAGAAYLPVDVDLPEERVRAMFESASPDCVAVLCGSAPEAERYGVSPSLFVHVDVPEALDGAAEADHAGPDPSATALDAAYVIFTSGSTGRPKGVIVSHRAIVAHLEWMQEEYGLTGQDRVLQKTPAGFDVSVWEFFWPLTTGATLVVAERTAHRDPAALIEVIEKESVTTVHFVPPMLGAFLDELDPGRCGSLARVFASGEALTADHCHRFQELCDATLHNLYGPTEAAIDVSAWLCPKAFSGTRVPIGTPVSGTRLHVLDDRLEPASAGAVGELYISGAQLARGYIGAPALTAERFVACPFEGAGERMYRTGDLARWSESGDLEFRGRRDSQVKINGVRVELAEVEAALRRHPAVKDAVAVVHGQGTDAAYLGAYVTADTAVVPEIDRQLRLAELAAEQRLRVIDLAPGMPACVLNEPEARFMYREIFEEQGYLGPGVRIPQTGCVLDVGANLGLFSLFIALQSPDVRVHAFEPVPEVMAALCENIALYGVDIVTHQTAVGDAPGETEFTYYPFNTLMSGRYAHAEADQAVVREFTKGSADGDESLIDDRVLDELVADRLAGRPITVPVTTISNVIDTAGIARIDLLKIDVEHSELDVLRGIEDRHWRIIEQIVMELHDIGGRLDKITTLLDKQGFQVSTQRESGRGMEGMYHLWAVRPGPDGAQLARSQRTSPGHRGLITLGNLAAGVRGAAAGILPSAMLPSTVTLVRRLPLTPNGKVDRRALAESAPKSPAIPGRTAPVSAREAALCELIRKVLRIDELGVDENLIDRGVTSLAAIKIVTAVGKAFNVSLKFQTLMQHPTVAALARSLEESEGAAWHASDGGRARSDRRHTR